MGCDWLVISPNQPPVDKELTELHSVPWAEMTRFKSFESREIAFLGRQASRTVL